MRGGRWGGGGGECGSDRGIYPFRSDLLSGCGELGEKELNKPKGLGYFSCDTPHKRRVGGAVGGSSVALWLEDPHMPPVLDLISSGQANANICHF